MDAQGNVYVAGTTGNAALPLPTTVIGGTTAYNHQEPFVTKISSDGKTALYNLTSAALCLIRALIAVMAPAMPMYVATLVQISHDARRISADYAYGRNSLH